MIKWSRLLFWLNYVLGRTPWDTNVTPPELVRTIEGPDALPPGRALDLGCGSGTNVIYLARHGWQATGVDFVGRVVQQARQKAQAAGVTARFYTGDVTRLDQVNGLAESFDFVLDIGCLHTLTNDHRGRYAAGVIKRLRPGGSYLLYAWGSHQLRGQEMGISPAQVEETFAPSLCLTRVEHGEERGLPSAWYWLIRPRLEK
jgi:SAM-dependent methyltransferase